MFIKIVGQEKLTWLLLFVLDPAVTSERTKVPTSSRCPSLSAVFLRKTNTSLPKHSSANLPPLPRLPILAQSSPPHFNARHFQIPRIRTNMNLVLPFPMLIIRDPKTAPLGFVGVEGSDGVLSGD